MKYWLAMIMLVFTCCGGSLSDEQRKRMREQMELHEIRRVSDTEITEAAFARGRKVMLSLENLHGDSARIDSFIEASAGKIRWLVPGGSNAIALEQQLIDAYIASGTGSLQDNVQKIRNAEGDSDSLLYTKPVVTKLPDGTDRLKGVWNIWLSKKELILSMDKK
jgi:hypothetical protein